MASWDSYIDNLIDSAKDATGMAHCSKVCIIGMDGGASWTTSTHPNSIKLSGSEGPTLANCFKKKDFAHLQANGIFAEEIKYQFLRGDDDHKFVLAKKKGSGGLTIQASNTAIVIGYTIEGGQQGIVNLSVSKTAEYLESMGM